MFAGGCRNIVSLSNLAISPSREFNSFFTNSEKKIRLPEN